MFTNFIFYENSLLLILKLTDWVYEHFWSMHRVISRNTSGWHFFNLVISINYLFVLTLIISFLSNKPAGCCTACPAIFYTTYKKKTFKNNEMN